MHRKHMSLCRQLVMGACNAEHMKHSNGHELCWMRQAERGGGLTGKAMAKRETIEIGAWKSWALCTLTSSLAPALAFLEPCSGSVQVHAQATLSTRV